MKVYPLKTVPTAAVRSWGAGRLRALYQRGGEGERIGETTELSPALRVAEGEYQNLTVGQLASRFGEEFTGSEQKGISYRIRLLDTMCRTPTYVYPDEREAKGMHGHYELAVILRAEPNAGLYAGFRREIGREEFLELAAEGKLHRQMHFLPAVPGDVFFLPGGLPVAVGGGITLMAVSGGSEERFTVEGNEAGKNYGYVQKDLRAMKFVGKSETFPWGKERRAVYGPLSAEEVTLSGRVEKPTEQRLVSLFVSRGEGILETGGESAPFRPGDSFLIPAEAESFRAEGNAALFLFR